MAKRDECHNIDSDLLVSLDNYLTAREALRLAKELRLKTARMTEPPIETFELDYHQAEELLKLNLERFVKCKR